MSLEFVSRSKIPPDLLNCAYLQACRRRVPISILVTGGCGYFGSRMVHALVDAGERVVVLNNLSTGVRSAVPQSVPLVVGDVSNQALVERIAHKHM
jgi:nucleoside-diphosphate-sugar epimerase